MLESTDFSWHMKVDFVEGEKLENPKRILGFLSQILTLKPQKRRLIGAACSKDLTCGPRGSRVFSFTSSPHTHSRARKPLGFRDKYCT